MKILLGTLLVLFVVLVAFNSFVAAQLGSWLARPRNPVSLYGKYASAYCEKYEITSPGCLK